eukprot:1078629_1
MQETINDEGGDDMYNLFQTKSAMSQMHNQLNPMGYQGQGMVNSMAQGMDASRQRQSIRQEARNAIAAIRRTMAQAQRRLNSALQQIHNYISQVGSGYNKMQGQIGQNLNRLQREGSQIMNANQQALSKNEQAMKGFAGQLQNQFNNNPELA